jgi:GTP cyclohydrolase I
MGMSAITDRPLWAETGVVDPRTHLIAQRFRAFLESLGVDLSDPTLEGTPLRVARAWPEILAGLDESKVPDMRTFPNVEGYSRMVAMTGIPFHSVCGHHFLPFFGTAHVAYLPGDRVVGLTKLARAVEYYARRPQTQERLTEQVVDLVDREVRPVGAMVVVEARHLCMEMRGAKKPGAATRTSAFRGAFSEESQRREFLDLIR